MPAPDEEVVLGHGGSHFLQAHAEPIGAAREASRYTMYTADFMVDRWPGIRKEAVSTA
jgi:hypothetical protein